MVFSECGFLVAICQLLFCFVLGLISRFLAVSALRGRYYVGVSGGRFAADYIFFAPLVAYCLLERKFCLLRLLCLFYPSGDRCRRREDVICCVPVVYGWTVLAVFYNVVYSS